MVFPGRFAEAEAASVNVVVVLLVVVVRLAVFLLSFSLLAMEPLLLLLLPTHPLLVSVDSCPASQSGWFWSRTSR